ncbi:MAG TPA: folate-binding protein [Verrucomicrobia bacterium]|nr:folate-binding protein [Verrucomicrobiales bacterium]HIL55492.1 folate-binding protein [Verrucomicrobiota bacterium]
MKSIDLSRRAKFRVSGKDRVRYLNGQVSNDVNKASEIEAISACVTTLKGRLEGLIWISVDEESQSFLIDSDPELRNSLFQRLSKYIIADDVEIIDVTDDYLLIHDLGQTEIDGIKSNRFSIDGTDQWVRPGELSAGPDWVSEKVLESLRISQGVPKWGNELDHKTLPQEALLDRTSVDFHKGCYVGQEIISRLESVGQVKRILVGLSFDPETVPAPGWSLCDEENNEVGTVTSVSSDKGSVIGLGYLKRAHCAVHANNAEKTLQSSVEIRNTPFTDS